MKKESLIKLSKAELYDRAQNADVPGRSEMGKEELISALSNGSDGSPKARKRSSTKARPKPERASTSQRSIWSGAITFGLITIPVGLYTATEERDISFHQL